jgi:hypothetical protein
MNEEELRLMQTAMEEMRRFGQVSAETMAKLNGETDSLNAKFKATEKSVNTFSKETLNAARDVGSWGSALAKGQGSFTSLSNTLTGLTGVVGKLASALPLVGGAAKALAEGVGEAGKFVLDQLDQMAKNYQGLGDASAIAADGVDGLHRQFQQIGLVSLPAFVKAVGQNTKGMAAFGAGVANGAEQFSILAGSLTRGKVGEEFLKLGMSFDQVGASAAQYVSTFARYGGLQKTTTEQLTKKTQDYIKEVDLIARMTGQTRAEQEAEQQKSLNDARFRAKIAEMNANGQQEQAAQLDAYVKGLGGAAGDAARAMLNGVPMTDEAAQANLLYGDQIRQSVAAIQAGSKATTEMTKTMEAGAEGAKNFSKNIQYTGVESFGAATIQAYDHLALMDKARATAQKDGITLDQAVAAEQDKLIKATGKNTEAFVGAQSATAQASKNVQELGFSLAVYAVPTVKQFSKALEKVTGWINETIGDKAKAESAMGKNTGMLGGLIKGSSALAGAGTGAMIGSMAGPVGTVVGGLVGGIAGYMGGSASAGMIEQEAGGGVAPRSAASKNDLASAGLVMKKGDVQREGAEVSPKLIEIAKAVQGSLPGFQYFSSFNDNYHADSSSNHAKGLAADFVLANKPDKDMGQRIVSYLKDMGASMAIDEYNNPSAKATAGHIHFEVPGFRTGGITNGLSFAGEAGPEAVVPLPDGRKIPVSITSEWPDMMGGDASMILADRTDKLTQQLIKMENQGTTPAYSSGADTTSILTAQLEKLEEIARVMASQVSVSNKILQYQQ